MTTSRLESLLIQKCKDYEVHESDVHQIVEQGLELFSPMPNYPAPPKPRDPQSNITVDSFVLRFKGQSRLSSSLSTIEKQNLALNEAAATGDFKKFKELREQGHTLPGQNPSKTVTYQNTVVLG